MPEAIGFAETGVGQKRDHQVKCNAYLGIAFGLHRIGPSGPGPPERGEYCDPASHQRPFARGVEAAPLGHQGEGEEERKPKHRREHHSEVFRVVACIRKRDPGIGGDGWTFGIYPTTTADGVTAVAHATWGADKEADTSRHRSVISWSALR